MFIQEKLKENFFIVIKESEDENLEEEVESFQNSLIKKLGFKEVVKILVRFFNKSKINEFEFGM